MPMCPSAMRSFAPRMRSYDKAVEAIAEPATTPAVWMNVRRSTFLSSEFCMFASISYNLPLEGISKHDSDTEPELPLVDPFAAEILHAGDRHEVFAVADVVVGSGQVRRVGEIVRLEAQLHSEAACRRDLAGQAEVPVEEARSA